MVHGTVSLQIFVTGDALNDEDRMTYHIKSPALHASSSEFEVVVLACFMLDLRVGLI